MRASRALVPSVLSPLTLLWTLLFCAQYCGRVCADGVTETEVRNGRHRHLQAEQNSSIIYGNCLEPDWILQSAGVTTQQVPGAVNNGPPSFLCKFS